MIAKSNSLTLDRIAAVLGSLIMEDLSKPSIIIPAIYQLYLAVEIQSAYGMFAWLVKSTRMRAIKSW
jgi:hypothetical protein